MIPAIVICCLFLLMIPGFFLQLYFFRTLGANQPISSHLARLSGMPIFVVFYMVVVPPVAFCLSPRDWASIVVSLVGAMMLVTIWLILQFAVYFLALENSIFLKRDELATESREHRERLIWYFRHFSWIPGKRMTEAQIDSMLAELKQMSGSV